jgi:hypothetical protein
VYNLIIKKTKNCLGGFNQGHIPEDNRARQFYSCFSNGSEVFLFSGVSNNGKFHIQSSSNNVLI